MVSAGSFNTISSPTDRNYCSSYLVTTSSHLFWSVASQSSPTPQPTFSLQPLGARAVLVSSFPCIVIFGLTFRAINAASCKSTFFHIIDGARSILAHSSSNLPGLGTAKLLIILLVDSSTYENCVNFSTAAFLPKKNGYIASENFTFLLSFVSIA